MNKNLILRLSLYLLVLAMLVGCIASCNIVSQNSESSQTAGTSLEESEKKTESSPDETTEPQDDSDESISSSVDESESEETTDGTTDPEDTSSAETTSEETTTEETTTEETTTEEITTAETETNMILGDEVEYASNFTVSKVFDSNMVIQRNEYVRVWGFADESENGKKVSAYFMGAQADAIIENGEWEVTFYQKYEANKNLGNSLTVRGAEGTEYVFEDILIGDVFMVVGQSNVQFSISAYLGAEPNLKWTKEQISEDSIIRFNYNSNQQSEGYPTRGTDEVVKDAINGYGWVKPDATNIDKLSAIGYFIAYQITELTDNGIPVGISQFSANGRPLSVFMPNELAEELGSDHFSEEKGIYVGNHHTNVETRYMYNHYINPFARMPIAGIVWYQGEAESPTDLASVYVERFTALMEYMRSTHNLVNRDFPVFFVEYPSVYKVAGSSSYLDTGRIRATVGMIPYSLSNSYVAVCADLWNDKTNDNNIHPYCKYEQAERVTALMQAVIYGGKTLDEATGPLLESYEVSKDKKTVVLKFTNCGEGLTTADGGTVVNGFGGMNNKNAIHYGCIATAEITAPDTITVTFSRSTLGIAYNFVDSNFYGVDVNLCDSYGNPAQGIWIYFGPSN